MIGGGNDNWMHKYKRDKYMAHDAMEMEIRAPVHLPPGGNDNDNQS